MKPSLLHTIKLPEHLRSLNPEELKILAAELREELITSVSTSGGHFASSLGTTELTVALHACFETPEDKIIWDVGHQAYIHKMITGRLSQMHSIRKAGGISGFLRRDESEYDVFGAGHAGTSISAAVGVSLGMAKKDRNNYTVSVIGDGSLTAGMAFEAMNHAGALKLKNFIVVLNDNEMSISENVGALSWLFSKAKTGPVSTMARAGFKQLHRSGYVPDIVYKAIDRAEEAAQGFISHTAALFESFGFRYIGPVDGHNIDDLITAFRHARQQDIPVLIHVRTSKGKGYEPAEEDPITWHGVTPFDKEKAEFLQAATPAKVAAPSFTSVFSKTLTTLAQKDPKIIGITAAMAGGTGLDAFKAAVPDQFIDVGICEQHAVTFAAGLACEGLKPVCAIYSTFLQRAYDQVLHDVCIQKLPVVFAIDRAGVVGNDGETHQGVFDIAYLRTIPHMTIMSPKDENELQHMLYTAISETPGPVAVRYPRGSGSGIAMDKKFKSIPIGKGEVIQSGEKVVFIAFGPVIQSVIRACVEIRETLGVQPTIINARFAKPLDNELILSEVEKHDTVITIEDHTVTGGFGSAVIELLNDKLKSSPKVITLGVHDEFVPHGTQNEQQAANGYDTQSIVTLLKSIYSSKAVKKKSAA